MEDEPAFTVRVVGEEPRCTVALEPVGSEYELVAGDALLIHVYGRSTREEDADVEVIRSDGRLTLWIASTDYRVWDKAGTERREL
jgi:protein involved in polysaccharide export with SLBB domain